MYRTAPFQNPATARTAGSCERTGAAKAPVLSPAIFLTGRFTLDSGGSVFQQSSLPSVTRCRQELKTCSGGHMDAAPAPFAPHSGSQGQTGAELLKRSMTEKKWLLLCQRHRNSGIGRMRISSLCPSALGPQKWARASARNCGRRIARRDACPAERQDTF